jgi:hypothetical protein
MSPLLVEALKAITHGTNLETGLLHDSDMDSAKVMFSLLKRHGETLHAHEIAEWAADHGWRPADAQELGELARDIFLGVVTDIPDEACWSYDIIEQLRRRGESQA